MICYTVPVPPSIDLGANIDRYFEGCSSGPPRVVDAPPEWVRKRRPFAPLPDELFEPFVNVGPIR